MSPCTFFYTAQVSTGPDKDEVGVPSVDGKKCEGTGLVQSMPILVCPHTAEWLMVPANRAINCSQGCRITRCESSNHHEGTFPPTSCLSSKRHCQCSLTYVFCFVSDSFVHQTDRREKQSLITYDSKWETRARKVKVMSLASGHHRIMEAAQWGPRDDGFRQG